MKQRILFALMTLTGFFAVWMSPREAHAIPPFARKYQTTCTTCHIAPPTLNTFGQAFKLNGYQFPRDDDIMVKDEPVPLGAEAQKEAWPRSIWPSTIPHLPPIALRYFGDFTYTPSQRPTNNFNFPNFWRLLAGGGLDDDISFFFTVCFKTDFGGTRATIPPNDKIAQAVQFQAQVIHKDLFEETLGENTLNVRYGLLDVRNFYINNFFQHLLITNYLYASKISPESGNDFSFLEPGGSPGIEAFGLLAKQRLLWSATLNNGDDFGVTDDNSHKDYSFVSRYKLGGSPYGGEGAQTAAEGGEVRRGDPASFLGWDNTSLQIGGLFYRGDAVVTGGGNDQFWRAGVDVHFQHGLEYASEMGGWELTGAYLWGHHNDPWGTSSREDADLNSWYVEGDWIAFPWLIPGLRVEGLSADQPTDFATTDIDAVRVVPSLTIRLRHNLKWVLEANIYSKNDAIEKAGGDASDANTYLFRFDIDF
ncbi:MAG: hypothetical protein HYU36_19335 [Planctomycetes bacterium]|nr:hypothetical protein [Planctomycetota bacterium]